MGRFSRQFEPLYERWRGDIRVFAREAMNFDYTWQQEELLDIVQLESWLPVEKRLKRIAVRSGQGPGKTSISVIVALWRCLRYEDSLCIVTSPSMRQCKQWIDECARLLKDAHPVLQKMCKTYGTKVEINGSKMWGIRTATATRPENLQGIHEKRLTFIADEASGVAPGIIETIKGTLSNPDALFLAIGNPNTASCEFYNFFTSQADMWHRLRFNAEDTARDYPHIVSPSRNKQLEWEYGRDSDQYRIRVLGEFPHEDPNNVMGLRDLTICTKTNLLGCASITDMLPVNAAIGIDYARFGGDESVIAVRHGLAITHFKTFVKTEPISVTDYAFARQRDENWSDEDCWFIPDAGGMGQGVMHSFHEGGKNVLEFHTQARPYDSAMFADLYSEAWWMLRNLVREHIVRIPNDARLLKQLSTRQYYTDRKGKLKVETKDEWRKRMEVSESPDRADAIVYAFYPHIGLTGELVQSGGNNHTVGTRIQRKR
jgi:phage terminase large subunit